ARSTVYILFRYFDCLVLLPSIILRGFSGLPKISYRGWRRCGAIGASGISSISGASGGVAGVEPDGVDIDSGGVGVNLGVGRLNSDYLESIDESVEESF